MGDVNKKFVIIALVFFVLAVLSVIFSIGFDFKKSEAIPLVDDGKAFLYEVLSEEKKVYVATNKKLDDQKMVSKLISTNAFWDPEHCASMLTLSTTNYIYFFESKFKEGSASDFYDVVYKFDIKNNTLQTFDFKDHKNIYSVILENENIVVYYKINETQKFYKSNLDEKGGNLVYVNVNEIREADIKYGEWKGKLDELDKVTGLKYFVIQ